MWEGVGDRTELQHIDPHSSGHNNISFLFSCAVQPGAHFAGYWFSLPHLISNWLNFLCTELYNSSTPTFFLWASQITLIQPVHGQGYILIFLDRMHLLFTQVHFLFWQPGQIGGQYKTEITSLAFQNSMSNGHWVARLKYQYKTSGKVEILLLCSCLDNQKAHTSVYVSQKRGALALTNLVL